MEEKLKLMMVVCNHCGGKFKASGRSEVARGEYDSSSESG